MYTFMHQSETTTIRCGECGKEFCSMLNEYTPPIHASDLQCLFHNDRISVYCFTGYDPSKYCLFWIENKHTYCDGLWSSSFNTATGTPRRIQKGDTANYLLLEPVVKQLVSSHDLTYFPSMYELSVAHGDRQMIRLVRRYAKKKFTAEEIKANKDLDLDKVISPSAKDLLMRYGY